MSQRIFNRLTGEAKNIWCEIEHDIKLPKYRKDPWAQREAWRAAPELSQKAGKKLIFGGSEYGVIAFVIYCVGEYIYKRRIKVEEKT